MARKPLSEGSVAQNTMVHGTGGIHVDACRIEVSSGDDIHDKNPHTQGGFGHAGALVYQASQGALPYDPTLGRWPANLILQHTQGCVKCPVDAMDQQSGIYTNTSYYSYKRRGDSFISSIPDQPEKDSWRMETGGASRFFKTLNA